MTNELKAYNNLTFIVLPDKSIEYDFHDYVDGKVKKIKASSDNGKVVLEIPQFKTNISLMINIPSIQEVKSSGKFLKASASWEEFLNTAGKYYYSSERNLLYVKLNGSKESRVIIIKTN